MITFVFIQHPVTTLVTAFKNYDKLTNKCLCMNKLSCKTGQTLVGPTWENFVLHPLAVTSLNNQLCMPIV